MFITVKYGNNESLLCARRVRRQIFLGGGDYRFFARGGCQSLRYDLRLGTALGLKAHLHSCALFTRNAIAIKTRDIRSSNPRTVFDSTPKNGQKSYFQSCQKVGSCMLS